MFLQPTGHEDPCLLFKHPLCATCRAKGDPAPVVTGGGGQAQGNGLQVGAPDW